MENAIWLHCDDGWILNFVECAAGLYAHDKSNPSHEITTHIENTQTVCLFVCLLGNLFSSGFNPSCVFALYSLEGS